MRLTKREKLGVAIYELLQDRNRHFDLAIQARLCGQFALAEKYSLSAERDTFKLEKLESEYRRS